MDNKGFIKNKKLFLFDMDGTLYLGNELFDFTIELLKTIREQGKDYIFMTNNSSKSVEDYIKKLARLGIPSVYDDFFTSSQATGLYLQEHCKGDKLYICGTESLKKELMKYGFEITEDLPSVDCIVMGNDTELTFKKLDDISYMLTKRDLKYIATNPDSVCPTEYGSVPDCGSVCNMIFNATGKRPIFIGKPKPEMPRIAMKMKGVSAEDTVVIGDRLNTDVLSGINAGASTILVLSGDTTREQLEKSEIKPDLVLENCGEILKELKR